MYFLVSIICLIYGCINGTDILIMTSGLFALADAIVQYSASTKSQAQ